VKTFLYMVLVVVGLAALIFLVQIIASESGEVVVLTTESPDGSKETRLWVVDLDGTQYLRARAKSGWYQRLLAAPEIRLTRQDDTAAYRAETRQDESAEVNRLMRAKYAWRDRIIELLVGGHDDAIAVALVPLP